MQTTKKTNNIQSPTNFYCSQKFWWLTVDISKIQTLSCCAATPAKIDLTWLRENPGKLFNTPELQHERKLMLSDVKVDSCSATCWNAEQQGLTSRRLSSESQLRTHTDINASPRILHIIIGNDCNMTCVYCCKQYSSAWTQDILTHGSYVGVDTQDDRFDLNNTDRVLLKLSQKDISNSDNTQLLFAEINRLAASSNLEEITITGGEPFLYLGLRNLVRAIPSHIKVNIWSGLGVGTARFARELSLLPRQVNVCISAESTDKLYEFVRYGNTWDRLQRNIAVLTEQQVTYSFYATISNLTLSGLPDFINWAGDTPVVYSPCTDPEFLSIHVLDNESKERIFNLLDNFPSPVQSMITTAMPNIPSVKQRLNFKNYLTTFAQRRSLELTMFPQSLINWATK